MAKIEWLSSFKKVLWFWFTRFIYVLLTRNFMCFLIFVISVKIVARVPEWMRILKFDFELFHLISPMKKWARCWVFKVEHFKNWEGPPGLLEILSLNPSLLSLDRSGMCACSGVSHQSHGQFIYQYKECHNYTLASK